MFQKISRIFCFLTLLVVFGRPYSADSMIQLLKIPDTFYQVNDSIKVTWDPFGVAACSLHYGTSPGVYDTAISVEATDSIAFVPSLEGMDTTNSYYCIVEDGADSSMEFTLIIETDIFGLPGNPISPTAGEVLDTEGELLPTFEWNEKNQAVTYYDLIL